MYDLSSRGIESTSEYRERITRNYVTGTQTLFINTNIIKCFSVWLSWKI